MEMGSEIIFDIPKYEAVFPEAKALEKALSISNFSVRTVI
jgi:hypothetical protein